MTILNRLRASITTFRRSEDGSMIILFLLFIFLMMPLVGLTITLNRAEHLRVKMQGTMDRAVLAAADIDQTLPPRDVVMDYFAKSGLEGYITPADITVYPDTADALRTGRRVSLCSHGNIHTNIANIESGTRADGGVYAAYAKNFQDFGFTACTGAEEAKSDIEVILVLDVSGSMEGRKLADMQDAAKNFVDTVLTADTAGGEISIGIVPYNGQVNAGSILSYYSTYGGNPAVSCIDFSNADYTSAGLVPASATAPTLYHRSSYFDPWGSSQTPFSSGGRDSSMPYCPTASSRAIMPPTDDAGALKAFIGGFFAAGYTSIENGVKWGAAMVDPSFRPVMTSLIAAGRVPSKFDGRPFDYGAAKTAKFIVVMSDGMNTSEWRLKSAYETGLSPFYRENGGSKRWSVYYQPHSGSNDYCYYDGSGGSSSDCSSWNSQPRGGVGTGSSNSTQMTWQDVWNQFTPSWISRNPYRAATGSTFTAYTSTSSGKDANTSAICTASKTAGATIFTIGFEAPDAGNAALLDCATSPGHFFDVDGLEIGEAFQAIARKISELRLTM